MAFNIIHWLPSSIAAVLVIYLVAFKPKKHYDLLGGAMAFFAIVGLVGYLMNFQSLTLGWDQHSVHIVAGFLALILSLYTWLYFNVFKLHRNKKYAKHRRLHVNIAKLAAVFAAIALIGGFMLFLGSGAPKSFPEEQAPASILPEVEAAEYQGIALTPISQQGNNAVSGTQRISREGYRLEVGGLVENGLSKSYEELLALPSYSEVAYMPCVEGWGFTAKWTGFRVMDLLGEAVLKPEGVYVMFHSADGYSTGLDVAYLRENNILLAYGLNDVTLPADRGFPLQLVAKSKYGYKWGKWITKIEVVDSETRGYWESRGYNNQADVGEPAFG